MYLSYISNFLSFHILLFLIFYIYYNSIFIKKQVPRF
nr:MAG TPA: hypothetical protein [Caudoviricetes sp.]